MAMARGAVGAVAIRQPSRSRRSITSSTARSHKEMIAVTLVCLLGFSAHVVNAYTDAALADLVTNLPGTEGLNIPFKQFSGYLDIPGTSGAKTKHMHYWYDMMNVIVV